MIISNEEFDMYETKKELTTKLNIEKNKTEENKKEEKLYKLIKLYKIIIFILIFIILLGFNPETSETIKVAYYCNSILYGGGLGRVIALLLNLLSEEKNFTLYLITKVGTPENEYPIPNNIKRIDLSSEKNLNIFKDIQRKHIDILVYNFYNIAEIEKMNKLKNTKVIFYDHSCFILWIYLGVYNLKNSIYGAYKNSKYVITLIPLENDYLFKKWGINSILMDNPLTFEYDLVTPSDLSQNNIIMIGREDIYKRFDIGIKSMKNIIKEIPECKMYIISKTSEELKQLIQSLELEKNIIFTEYQKNINIFKKFEFTHFSILSRRIWYGTK